MSVLLAVVLLAGNAFFVGAQFALITVRRDQVEPLARAGHRAARATFGQMRQLSRMLAGSQLGIAACSLGLGAVAEPTFARLLEAGFDAVRVPDSLRHPIAFFVALAAISYAHMVLGEMVPKNLALAGPLRSALLLGPPMAAWVRATRPLLIVINGAAVGVLKLFHVEPQAELAAAYTPDELAGMIAESAAEGLLPRSDQQRLIRALTLEKRAARDVTVPLADLVTIRPGTTVGDLEQLVAETGYSRFPVLVTRDDHTDLVGYLHSKDLLELDDDRRDQPISDQIVRPMVTVDQDLPLTATFAELQRAGRHMGRVTAGDRVLGVVALEDVLEELVGEIQDASHATRRRRGYPLRR